MTIKKGNSKPKKRYQFCEELVQSAEPLDPRREPTAEGARKVLDVKMLLHFPGEEHWCCQWKGEPEDSWREREKLGPIFWGQYIDQAKYSKKPATKTKLPFYVDLMKEGKAPIPIFKPTPKLGLKLRQRDEDLEEEGGLSGKALNGWASLDQGLLLHEQRKPTVWAREVRSEMPELVQEWKAQALSKGWKEPWPQKPVPGGLTDAKRLWWKVARNRECAQFGAEDQETRRQLQLIVDTKEAQASREAEWIASFSDAELLAAAAAACPGSPRYLVLVAERRRRYELKKQAETKLRDAAAIESRRVAELTDEQLSQENNNNNTFTWSRPSGVLDCTLRRPEVQSNGWYSRNSFAKIQVTRDRWSLEPVVSRATCKSRSGL
jgi:hypothetical protein